MVDNEIKVYESINFSFVLTDQEVSLFQSGIAIQTQGVAKPPRA